MDDKSARGENSPGEHTRAELIEEVHRVGERLDHAPEVREFIDVSEYPVFEYYQCDEFESWNEVVNAAGFDVLPTMAADPFELIDDLRSTYSIVKTNDGYMSGDLYRRFGEYSPGTVMERFGSWVNGLTAAGLPAEPKRDRSPNLSEEELLEAVEYVAEEVSNGLTVSEYDAHRPDDAPAGQTIIRRFGSWYDALEKAGVESAENSPPSPSYNKISRDELIAGLQALAVKLEEGVQSPEGDVERAVTMDADKLYPQGSPEEKLERTSYTPTTTDMEEYGPFSMTAYYNTFDSWADSLEAAGLADTK